MGMAGSDLRGDSFSQVASVVELGSHVGFKCCTVPSPACAAQDYRAHANLCISL